MIKGIARYIRQKIFERKFYARNKHNSVRVESHFPIANVSVGEMTYGPLNIVWMAPKNAKVRIGNYCSIGPKVTFLVGGEHDYKRISTWPFQTLIYNEPTFKQYDRNINVEDDVWIGYGSLILSGVTIGKGSVIGAGSVVAKNIPPYSIYVGNKIIKKRFPEQIIEKLMGIDYSAIHHYKNDEYKELCQTEVDINNVDEILRRFIKNE